MKKIGLEIGFMLKKKSNTAIICLSPNIGGMEINALNMALKLEKYIDIILIANEKGKIAGQFYEESLNKKLETINFLSTFSFSIILNARKIIKKHNIKNVIFYGASELKSLYFSFIGLDINLSVVHSTTKSTPKTDPFHRLIYSNVNYHISISKHLQNNVSKIIPMGKNSKSIMIYSGMKIKPLTVNKQSMITIIHTGRIARGKGQVEAIKACRVLYDNNIDFTFFVVGGYENEEYEKFFLSEYNKLEYKEKIILTGYTTNVEKYLSMSDIFLFPSHGEGFGKSIAEALTQGLVCIVYKNTSFFEFESLGFNLHLAENLSENDLKDKLAYCAMNLDTEKQKSKNNISLGSSLFTEEVEIKRYLEVLV